MKYGYAMYKSGASKWSKGFSDNDELIEWVRKQLTKAGTKVEVYESTDGKIFEKQAKFEA